MGGRPAHAYCRIPVCLLAASLLSGCGASLVSLVDAGDTGALKERLAAGDDPNQPDRATRPLVWAVYKEHSEQVAVLLAGKADPNARDQNQITPLGAAIYNGDPRMVEQLLIAGANPNHPSHNLRFHVLDSATMPPLLIALDELARPIGCRECVGGGGRFTRTGSFSAKPPPETYLSIAQLLLKHGADPNLGANEASEEVLRHVEEFPVHAAAWCASGSWLPSRRSPDSRQHCRRALELLVSARGSLSRKDRNGNLPIESAFHLWDSNTEAESFRTTQEYLRAAGSPALQDEFVKQLPLRSADRLVREIEGPEGLLQLRLAQFALGVQRGADPESSRTMRAGSLTPVEGSPLLSLLTIGVKTRSADVRERAFSYALALTHLGVKPVVQMLPLPYSSQKHCKPPPGASHEDTRTALCDVPGFIDGVVAEKNAQARRERIDKLIKVAMVAGGVMLVTTALASAPGPKADAAPAAAAPPAPEPARPEALKEKTIRGRVMRDSKHPCGGCAVTLSAQYLGYPVFSRSGKTSDDGFYEIKVPGGPTEMYVDGNEYKPSVDLERGQAQTVFVK